MRKEMVANEEELTPFGGVMSKLAIGGGDVGMKLARGMPAHRGAGTPTVV
jgi:hypothetical protein